MTKHEYLDMLSKAEILNRLKKQEVAWENAGTALGYLERRLRNLENNKFQADSVRMGTPLTGLRDNCNNLGKNRCEKDLIGHYGCIYVSPIYDDKKGNIMYRTQIVEDNHGVSSTSFNARLKVDEKDLEIKRLKAELQRRKLQDLEEEKNIIADKFIDQIDTNRIPTISRVKSYNERHAFKADQNTSITSCENLAENIGKMSILAPDWPKSIDQPVNSYLETMQVCVQNLCKYFKIYDSRNSINSGAVEDELFILKKTLCKLTEMDQEFGHQSFTCWDGKKSLDVEKQQDMQRTVDGLMQQLAQTEFKVISLESSCIEKDRQMEDLESRIQAILKDTEAIMMEKFELTTTVQEMHRGAEEQRHQIEELLSINEELLEFSQGKEDQLGNLQAEKEHSTQQLVQYEDTCNALKSLLQEKDREMEELSRRLRASQIGADAIIIEKIELTSKIQAMLKEAEEQKRRMDELVSINGELLEFAQSKDDQLACLNKEVKQPEKHDGENIQQQDGLLPNLEAKDADMNYVEARVKEFQESWREMF